MSINKETFVSRKSVSVQDFFVELFRRWYICVVIIAVCLGIAFTYANIVLTPRYDSRARLYIVNKTTETINSSDVSVSTFLANDFAEIIVDRVILTDVAADLGNKYTVSQLSSFLSVEIPVGTRIIQVTARTPDPETSKQVVDSVCRISEQKMVEVMGLDRVTIISEGSLPKFPSVPNTSRIMMLGFIASLFLSTFTIYVFIITDNKISSSKDVEKYLGINVLATIPFNQSKQKIKS